MQLVCIVEGDENYVVMDVGRKGGGQDRSVAPSNSTSFDGTPRGGYE